MPKPTTTTTPEQQHHFFASTAVSWAVGSTRQEAIDKAARIAGNDIIKRQIKPHGGLYCWSCRVDCPQSAHYYIENYAPRYLMDAEGKTLDVRVPLRDTMEFLIVSVKGHVRLKA